MHSLEVMFGGHDDSVGVDVLVKSSQVIAENVRIANEIQLKAVVGDLGEKTRDTLRKRLPTKYSWCDPPLNSCRFSV